MGLDHGLTSAAYDIDLRKANAIHAYFVDQYGGGEEPTGGTTYQVPFEDLEPLMLRIRDAVARRDATEFPPAEVGRWYWNDLLSFACDLEILIRENEPGATVQYWASW